MTNKNSIYIKSNATKRSSSSKDSTTLGNKACAKKLGTSDRQHKHPRVIRKHNIGRPLLEDGVSSVTARKAVEQKVGQLKKRVEQLPSISSKPVIANIDKLKFSILLEPSQLGGIIERALQLCKEKRLKHRSRKSEWYRHVFVLNFATGSKAVFEIEPNKPNAKTLATLTINPNRTHMTTEDVLRLRKVWKDLFGLGALSLASRMRVMRIDVCADAAYSIDNLIVDMDNVRTGAKFYIKTATGGRIETNYMGSVESASRGVAYDLDSSDDFKRAAGEVPSRHTRENAELVIESGKKELAGRIRIENRRVFKTHQSFAKLTKLKNPFEQFHVYDLSKGSHKFSLDFLMYLDCVRLRGQDGARKFLLSSAQKKAPEINKQISEHEGRLTNMAADWWKPTDFCSSLMGVLKTLPAWDFLKVIENPR
jgi:hypothetical protein